MLGALGSLIAGTIGTGGAGKVLLATGVATGEVATKGFVARDADEDTTVKEAAVGGADAREEDTGVVSAFSELLQAGSAVTFLVQKRSHSVNMVRCVAF